MPSFVLDDLGFDEISMTRHFTDSKRIALVTFINKYEGTPKLESLRAKLFERRSEIRALETTIVNAQQNIGQFILHLQYLIQQILSSRVLEEDC